MDSTLKLSGRYVAMGHKLTSVDGRLPMAGTFGDTMPAAEARFPQHLSGEIFGAVSSQFPHPIPHSCVLSNFTTQIIFNHQFSMQPSTSGNDFIFNHFHLRWSMVLIHYGDSDMEDSPTGHPWKVNLQSLVFRVEGQQMQALDEKAAQEFWVDGKGQEDEDIKRYQNASKCINH